MREFLLQFPEESRQRSKMAYRSFVRREHQSILQRIHDTTSSHFAYSKVTINSKNLFVNFRWTFTFALRNRMTERTSHLAGLWIGAAVSTRLTQTKPILPLSNEHGSQVKDQGLRHCCHNEHKKFPYRPTRDVSLLSENASYFSFTLRWVPDLLPKGGTLYFNLNIDHWRIPNGKCLQMEYNNVKNRYD